MIGPEVQKAIHDALKVAPALADGRVYDMVPPNAQFPYLTIGEEQIVDDSNSCGGGWEVFADVHAWSRNVGFPQAKILAADAVERILAITAVTGFALVSIELQDQRSMRDPDGLTSHVVASLKFTLDQA